MSPGPTFSLNYTPKPVLPCPFLGDLNMKILVPEIPHTDKCVTDQLDHIACGTHSKYYSIDLLSLKHLLKIFNCTHRIAQYVMLNLTYFLSVWSSFFSLWRLIKERIIAPRFTQCCWFFLASKSQPVSGCEVDLYVLVVSTTTYNSPRVSGVFLFLSF